MTDQVSSVRAHELSSGGEEGGVAHTDDLGPEERLADLRGRIDQIDRRILALLRLRGRAVLDVAEVKRSLGGRTFDPSRERQVIEELIASSGPPLDRDDVESIMSAVFDSSRRLQRRAARDSDGGPEGTRMANEKDAMEPTIENGDDDIFAQPKAAKDFDFGTDTAKVFDDMLDRSVPFYSEIERMIGELTADFAADESRIYDLGCSTANTALQVARFLPPERNVRFVGIDNSPEMLCIAEEKLRQASFPFPYELRCCDLHDDLVFDNASVAYLILTLQFVRPLYREQLLKRIYEGLRENGCLIMVEKVLGEQSLFNRLFIKYYYEMKKRHGYSDLEISQKREALENVLVPYRLNENLELLSRAGFGQIEVFFKWYNFCAIAAVK